MINANNNTWFETPVTVKWLIAFSTEKLLFINNSPILLRQVEKTSVSNPPPPPWKLPHFGPSLPSEFPLPSEGAGGGGGMEIFWNYIFIISSYQFNDQLPAAC